MPTRLGGAEFAGMRLDYLLGTPAWRSATRDCRVIRGGAAATASDHYPLLATLDFSRLTPPLVALPTTRAWRGPITVPP